MDFDEEKPKRSRRRVKVDEESPAAFVAGDPIETDDMPDPRSLWLNDADDGAEETATPFSPAEELPGTTWHEVEPQPASEPEPPKSRDIGNWRYMPWKGRDHWVHKDTIQTSFKEDYVRKHRHQ